MNRLECLSSFRLLFVWGIILELSLRGLCEIYPPIIWTPLNPIFHPTATGTSSNGTVFSMNVLPMSKLYIICPNQVLNPTKVQQSTPKELLYENLWIVDRKSFESCNINRTNKSNRLLMKCSRPLKLKYYPLVFQDFSATADVLEFERAKDYFFIATSNGQKSSLASTKLGHCHTHNMRIKMHVCLSATDPICIPTPTTRITTPTTKTTPTTPRTQTTTVTSTSSHPTTAPRVVHDSQESRETLPSVEQPKTEPKLSDDKIPPRETPRSDASKDARCARNAEDTTWLILVAVMGAIIAVSVTCNVYILCCKKASGQPRSDDKRSSAAHALLRENSRVDKV